MATLTPRPDLGEMYEPEAVADALRVGRATVYRLIRSGDLKASKVGRQYRISEASLNEYLGLEPQAA
jgi:putative molybdopterin biosynthesis protein